MNSKRSSQSRVRIWALVPAAGTGSRMRADRPKPYLRLGPRQIIDITLERLLSVSAIDRVYLALGADDPWWPETESAGSDRVVSYPGGRERVDSVRAGLDVIRSEAHRDDWVLVHDVARPCVSVSDIERLLEAVEDHPVGGLLGAPLVDTIKQVDDSGQVLGTADRAHLWRALTPQIFRFGVLDRALEQATFKGAAVTDESSAVEALGLRPLMIAGRSDNIKVTVPEDLALARWLLGLAGDVPAGN